MTLGTRFTTLMVGLVMVLAQDVRAAEIKVLSIPLRGPLEQIRSEFERTTGDRLLITYGPSAELQRRIDAGEAFDAIVSLPGQIDDLIKQGKVAHGTRVDVARAGLGVAVRKGAPRPDLASADAFRSVLLDAGSIAYAASGPSGMHLRSLIDRLGIAPQTAAKLRPMGAGSLVVAPVAKGEVDIGVVSIPFILAEPGVELAGPLPPELQHYVVNSAGIGTSARDVNAVKAFIRFLLEPGSVRVLRASGMEPVTP